MEKNDALDEAFAKIYAMYPELDDLVNRNGINTPVSSPAVQETATPPLPKCVPEIITLDVGGRIFKAKRDTLKQTSGFFKKYLSAGSSWSPQANGTYFLDHDPEIFEHLLRFIRRPEIFPLFYTNDASFNYDLYTRLSAEAEAFEVDVLHNWIEQKTYLNAIVTHTHYVQGHNILDTRYPAASSSPSFSEPLLANSSEEQHLLPRTRKIYLCPRGIVVHRGKRDMCGAACHKAQGSAEVLYDEEDYVEVVRIRKEVEFKADVCRAGA